MSIAVTGTSSPITNWLASWYTAPSEVDARFERHISRMQKNTAALKEDMNVESRTDGYWRNPHLHTYQETGFKPRTYFAPGSHPTQAGSEMNSIDSCIAYCDRVEASKKLATQ
jgi:hypothetical protein